MAVTSNKEPSAKTAKKASKPAVPSKPVEPSTAIVSVEKDKDACEICDKELDKLVRKHMILAGALGTVPVPVVDIAAVTGAQVNMIREISEKFDCPFKENRVKSILASLLSSLGASVVARGLASSLIKSIPAIGTLGGVIAMPIVSCAATYAVGHVFIKHFQSGGSLVDFDESEMNDYFKQMFKDGQAVAVDLKDEILCKVK